MRVNIKVLVALVTVLCLAGCGKAGPGPDGIGDVIRFTDRVRGDLDTKAYSENSIASIRQNGFKVACVTETNLVTVFNERAVWDGTLDAYVTESGMFYYPTGGEAVSFYAAYPASQSVDLHSSSAYLSYVSSPDTDLLTAVRTGVTARKTSVAMEFGHVLSLIAFKARGTDDDALYRLRRITVESPDGGVYDYSGGTWAPSGDTASVEVFSGDLPFLGTAEVGAPFTVVPCNPVIRVEWECWSTDGTVLMATYSESGSLEEALLPGEACTVTLVLSNREGNPMVFDVKVTPWDSEDHEVNLN